MPATSPPEPSGSQSQPMRAILPHHSYTNAEQRHDRLTNETLDSTVALGSGLVHEVCGDGVEATQQRAAEVARRLAQEPEHASALVDARDPVDSKRVAAEAVGHASCLDANGGRYADSALPHPDDAVPADFSPMVLEPPAHGARRPDPGAGGSGGDGTRRRRKTNGARRVARRARRRRSSRARRATRTRRRR